MLKTKRLAGRGSALALTLITSFLPLGGLAHAATPSNLSIIDNFKIEGQGSPNVLLFRVVRSGDLSGSAIVDFRTQAGGAPAATAGAACTPGVDYVATSGTLQLNPNDTSKAIPITICDDNLNEQNEVFNVVLSGAKNANIVRSTALGTILDDDPGKWNVLDSAGREENGTLGFSIILTRAYTVPVSVSWKTVSGTAVAGADYQPQTATVTFSPGTTRQNASIPLIKDGVREPAETFTVVLFNPVRAPIARPDSGVGGGSAVMTIQANNT